MKNSRSYLRRPPPDKAIDAAVYAILIFVLAVSVYPLYLAVVLSFNEGGGCPDGGHLLLAPQIHPEKLREILYRLLLAQGHDRHSVPHGSGHNAYGAVYLFCGLWPFASEPGGPQAIYEAVYLCHVFLRRGDTVLCGAAHTGPAGHLLVPSLLNLFYVLVAISFFQGIPEELQEAARVDGAGELRIFFSVILPVAKPLLATIAIFISVQHWNSWYDSAFFVKNQDLMTLAYRMMAVLNKSDLNQVTQASAAAASAVRVTPMSVQLAAMVIATMPVVVVYPFFQKYIISGVTIGSVKG